MLRVLEVKKFISSKYYWWNWRFPKRFHFTTWKSTFKSRNRGYVPFLLIQWRIIPDSTGFLSLFLSNILKLCAGLHTELKFYKVLEWIVFQVCISDGHWDLDYNAIHYAGHWWIQEAPRHNSILKVGIRAGGQKQQLERLTAFPVLGSPFVSCLWDSYHVEMEIIIYTSQDCCEIAWVIISKGAREWYIAGVQKLKTFLLLLLLLKGCYSGMHTIWNTFIKKWWSTDLVMNAIANFLSMGMQDELCHLCQKYYCHHKK